MIALPLRSLAASDHVERILISIEDPSVLDAVDIIHDGSLGKPVEIVESKDTLFDSVLGALSGRGHFPVVICTADNALQTTEMVDHFCETFLAEDMDAAPAMTRTEVLKAKYPDGQSTGYNFGGRRFHNCNLYGIRSEEALRTAEAFRGGGQFAKSKMRVLKAFGLLNTALFYTGKIPIQTVFKRISKRFGVKVRPVIMPFAEAPIDVDNERTRDITREILATRRMETSA